MSYRVLNPELICETAEKLRLRVCERFPDSGLSRIATELVKIVSDTSERIRLIGKPNISLRMAVGVAVLCLAVLAVWPFYALQMQATVGSWGELVQSIEAGINEIILLGAAIFFLASLEGRFKRKRALKALHELRSLAHIIDMHQLTKDPSKAVNIQQNTPSSPGRRMSEYELGRYLDYCSEMLSIIGKVGALYAQNLHDSVALNAVDEIEELTTSLSRKVWQKIMILDMRKK